MNKLLKVPNLLGAPGYSLPQNLAVQKSLSMLTIHGEASKLTVLAPSGCEITRPLEVHLLGAVENAVLVLGRHCDLTGQIRFWAKDQIAILAESCPENGHSGRIDVTIYSNRQTFFLGKGVTSNGTVFRLAGDDVDLVVGDDAMFATGVQVETTDSHAVSHLNSPDLINPPQDILIEPHVWVGDRTTVAKNVVVGAGSIVGRHSVVTKPVQRFVSVAGLPARLIKDCVTWDRYPIMRQSTLDQVQSLERLLNRYEASPSALLKRRRTIGVSLPSNDLPVTPHRSEVRPKKRKTFWHKLREILSPLR